MAPSADDIQRFLAAYPRMALLPRASADTVLEGHFDFRASPAGGPEVRDTYGLRIEVPEDAEALPRVFETGGRIPRNANDHVYPTAGNLCLASPLRLRLKIGRQLDLLKFADECIVPYLYAATRRPIEGRYVFNELAHGRPGLLQDYEEILGVSGEARVLATLRILAARPRQANKHPCPCGCGQRLGLCPYRDRVARIREIAPRAYFQKLYRSMQPNAAGDKA